MPSARATISNISFKVPRALFERFRDAITETKHKRTTALRSLAEFFSALPKETRTTLIMSPQESAEMFARFVRESAAKGSASGGETDKR